MEKIIVECVQCQKRMRVPAEGDLQVTCPGCGYVWEFIRSRSPDIQVEVSNHSQLPGFDELTSEQLEKVLEKIKKTKVNVMIVGGTGTGKSSTINGLFHNVGIPSSAKVGQTANPETMEVRSFALNNVVIWDTPGLGDSEVKDAQHIEKITKLLHEKDESGHPLIDLVLLVMDGASRDLSSMYTLIKDVIAPNLNHVNDKSRLLIGINKIDKIKHHKFWNELENKPSEKLAEDIEALVKVVQDRIFADTGFRPEVVTYCAGQKDEETGEWLQEPYNLGKLLSFVLDLIPAKKRFAFSNDINKDKKNFKSNDQRENYQEKVERSIFTSLKEVIVDVCGDAIKAAGNLIVDTLNSPQVKNAILTFGMNALRQFLKGGK